ncbi:MAG: sterol desaturase family protein [Myxococcota bacterium]|nr:sterol desaturase family protein [Myxococcota bacterium]
MAYILLAFLVMAALERFSAGYAWPEQPWWRLRGLVWLGLVLGLGGLSTRCWFPLLEAVRPWDLTALGLWAAVPALLVYQLLIYWIHRALHAVPLLWRIHQHHHSSERIDVWSTYRVHPLELPIFGVASAIAFGGVLGLSEGAATLVGGILAVTQTFEHTNIRTPRWLGYLVARPENHMLHHARHHHDRNYADIPAIDMLFGTFECPASAPKEAGFWAGASGQLGRLLLLRSITRPGGPSGTQRAQQG